MTYLIRLYAVAPDLVDEAVAALWEAGTLGVEEGKPAADGTVPLEAWFSAEAAPEVELPDGARLVGERTQGDEDWLAGFRAHAQPLLVGERLLVDPREVDAPAPEVPAGRTLLRLPARTAFGTGSHATTRLVLRVLEGLPLAGASLLDVGTGSGILSLAALVFGARRALGYDIDLAASLLAGQYARLNGADARFWAGTIDSLAPAARFDVVVVNALPHEVLAEAGRLLAAVRPGGLLVVSGVPLVDAEAVLAAWTAVGARRAVAIEPHEVVEEEWIAWVLEPAKATAAAADPRAVR